MKIAVICDPDGHELAEELAGALKTSGLNAALLEPAAPESTALGAALAHYLVTLEAELETGGFDAVALIGNGDRPFAGVLVATKALVPAVRLTNGGREGHAENGALIDRLADHLAPEDALGAAEAITRSLGA